MNRTRNLRVEIKVFVVLFSLCSQIPEYYLIICREININSNFLILYSLIITYLLLIFDIRNAVKLILGLSKTNNGAMSRRDRNRDRDTDLTKTHIQNTKKKKKNHISDPQFSRFIKMGIHIFFICK